MSIFADFAPEYWSYNLPVIPLKPGSKVPMPDQWQNFGIYMPAPELRDSWLRNYPSSNIGLPLGPCSKVCMIDIDTTDKLQIDKIMSLLPASPWKRVGKKGMALAYRYEGQSNFKLKDDSGAMVIEFLGRGNQLVLPPSIHPDTQLPYTENRPLWEVLDDLPSLPMDLKARLRELLGIASSRPRAAIGANVIVEGGRHNALVSAAGRFRNAGMTGELLAATLHTYNREYLDPPLPVVEVDAIVRAATEQWSGGDGHQFTDVGNGRRLAERLQERAVFVSECGEWRVFEGGRWSRDRLIEVEQEAKALTDCLCANEDPDWQKWGRSSQSSQRLSSMIKMAQSEPSMTASVSMFDKDLDSLNTPSGVVDLRTGALRPASASDYNSKLTSAAYDPDARCPRFDQFMSQVFPDPDIASFVQRWVGYCLTGHTSEQKFLIASGSGANGKGTLLNTIKKMMGDYAVATPMSTFVERARNAATNDLVALSGARFVIANEGNQGDALDSALIKNLTGQDPVTARYLFKEYVTFEPQFKPIIVSNHMPEIDANDSAMWRRILILPFTQTFSEADKDLTLLSKLQEEGAGILRWAVDGAVAWYRTGLNAPAAIARAVANYHAELDTIGAFINERCVVNADAECVGSHLYLAYEHYVRALDVKVPTNTLFGRELNKRGYTSRKTNGHSVRCGLALKPFAYEAA